MSEQDVVADEMVISFQAVCGHQQMMSIDANTDDNVILAIVSTSMCTKCALASDLKE